MREIILYVNKKGNFIEETMKQLAEQKIGFVIDGNIYVWRGDRHGIVGKLKPLKNYDNLMDYDSACRTVLSIYSVVNCVEFKIEEEVFSRFNKGDNKKNGGSR
ncbi:hypothetical protein [Salinicola rhizosphaerae]|uniref:Uncharacterized protein n=1 Tax=Salinicola rhizosphaerae TaxID=1443141 RepID=A0ABQ3DSE7_9GAMM|nr:hypothetical protein [Salinicola rhizosphaerae]GHB12922.1 hypothetical protein GCM10009038_08700 [Salinicola rhizosphaerae]